MKGPKHNNAQKGAYVLIIYLSHEKNIRVGKLGDFKFPEGHYAYVGSAFGPGGLAARIKHHLMPTNRSHWHIDYFLQSARIEGIWVIQENERREHHWASVLNHCNGASIPAAGFGSSDCSCSSHLFHFKKRPLADAFKQVWEARFEQT